MEYEVFVGGVGVVRRADSGLPREVGVGTTERCSPGQSARRVGTHELWRGQFPVEGKMGHLV